MLTFIKAEMSKLDATPYVSGIAEISGYWGWDWELCIADFSQTLSRRTAWVTKSYKPLLKSSESSNSPPRRWWMLSLVTDHLGSTGSVLFKLRLCVPLSTFSPLLVVVLGVQLKFNSLTSQGIRAIGSVLVLSQLLHALLKLFQGLRV